MDKDNDYFVINTNGCDTNRQFGSVLSYSDIELRVLSELEDGKEFKPFIEPVHGGVSIKPELELIPEAICVSEEVYSKLIKERLGDCIIGTPISTATDEI